MRVWLLGSLAFVALATIPCVAHHSPAALYRMSQEIVVKGIVTEFQFTNPHARILLDVTNSKGEVKQWLAEGGTPNVLRRLGWDGQEVQPGDYVEVTGNPARDRSNVVHWVTIILADGSELFGEDYNFDAVDRRRRLQ